MSYKVGDSPFWNLLWKQYPKIPSIVLCRIPELEYASKLNVNCNVLDHCCGDGKFASLAWPNNVITAGCDINASSIEHAKVLNKYKRLDVCDASKHLPYDDEFFNIVFNNSAIEHIPDLDATLSEITRVLAPEGTFAFNVLNHRFYEWWPFDEHTKKEYMRYQPIYHKLNLDEWKIELEKHNLKIVSVEGYFDKKAAQALASIDYKYSNVYLNNGHEFIVTMNDVFPGLIQKYWHIKLSSQIWKTDSDNGAGYFIKAIHTK